MPLQPPATEKPDESIYGVPRYKAGPDGLTVRLALVVRWLMDAHQMARVDALSKLLEPLRGESPPELYVLQPGGNAKPIDGFEWYASDSGAFVARRYVNSPPASASLGLGRHGALSWVSSAWGKTSLGDEVMDRPATMAAYLAVSVTDAAALWGYGVAQIVEAVQSVAAGTAQIDMTYAELTTYRKASKKDGWTDEMLRVFLREHARRKGEKGLAKIMAAEFEITVTAVNQTVATAKRRAKTAGALPTSTGLPVSNVFELSQKTG